MQEAKYIMRIYDNIPALTAYNSLNGTNNAMEKTIQKLSTGLRINSAADDAAGFAISEKMRSQISGLEIAIRNTQDANSMLQTAEGALGETNSMLQRMRELAVQASNDTLTSQDRSYIQLEIDQLADQIDRIANTTQFNKKRLLDGSSAGITTSSNLSVKAYVNGSLREIDQFGQKKSFEGNYKITVNVDPNQVGKGQVQKSSIMTIKHPNVITKVQSNADNGITNTAVDSLPAGDYEVIAATSSIGDSATIVGGYGFTDTNNSDANMLADDITSASMFTITAANGSNNYLNNANILFEVTSVTKDGVSTGRYLVFFDTEQGYNYESRQIDEIADALALNGARFILDTNKRVPTNKEIVSFAKMLLNGTPTKDLFQCIIKENYASTQVFYFDGAKQLIKHINQIKKEIREGAKNWNEYVILADSSTKKEQTAGNEKLYDRIATIEGIKELSPHNICQDTSEIPFTSMLSYKGLECKHVILVINGRTEISTLELYIGMTRAIMDLQLLVLQ